MALQRVDGLECIGAVTSVSEAVAAIVRDRPDVVIMDWQMPDVDGVEGIGRIHSVAPATIVILVSGHADSTLERLVVAAGGAALLPKESSIADIVSVVRRCTSGEVVRAARPGDAASSARLTPRETEVLWLLARGKDAPKIASELYLSVHTVRGYIKDVRQKLGATSQLEAVARARDHGLLP